MNNHLEQAVLHACVLGYLSAPQLKPHLKTFSKEGKCIAQAVKWLLDQGQTPPFTLSNVELTCNEVFSHDRDVIAGYVREMGGRTAGQETAAIASAALEKFKMLELQAALNEQVATRTYQPEKLQDIILEGAKEKACGLLSLADVAKTWKGEINEHNRGLYLGESFPRIEAETRGLSGMWVIGGLPGVGKSTLAFQLGLIAAKQRPVLYYDMENTEQRLYERTVRAFDGDVGAADEALRRVFVRQDPRQIFGEVSELGEAACIIVDSLQKLPSDVHVKRETMEDWLQRLDKLKQQGHIIIIVSQLNRSEGNYKGTNDIEHTADFGIKLDCDAEDPSVSDVYIEKNRHGKNQGWLCQIRRHNVWLMRE